METTAPVVNQQFSNMSLVASIESLDESSRKNISDDLIIRIDNPSQKYSKAPPTYLEAFQASSASISLPFAWAISEKIGHRPGRSHFPGAFPCFEGECRGDQKEVKKKCMRSFNSTGSVLVSCFPGWGKTFLAINLASSIKLKTIIFVNKIVLMKQWENSIRRFVKDAKVAQISTLSAKASQRAQQKWEQQWDSDFVIINAINVPKMPQKFLSRFGFVVVDECHQLVSACLSRSLLQVHPRYLLGLSATPYRKDGLDRLIALYFGKNKITKKLFKLHHVHAVETGFRPRVKHTVQGRLDWNAVLESQSMDENRNNLIVDWTLHFCQKKRKILILTKRICQAEILVQKLIQKGENSIATLWGGKQTFDKRSQILIGTSSKIGVGFDHKHLDCLILASDIKEYFIQYLGRVFRQPGTTPVIVDFVDDHGLLRRHFGVRKKAYTQHGGQIIATKINKEKK